MKLYYQIEVDLFRPYPLPIMDAQQNNIGRGAQVTLKANGAIIQPTNEGLTFWAKKPDGTVSFLAATLSGTNVQLDFTSQMLALPGMVQVEIRMTSGDGADKTDISTPIFDVRVNPSNIDDAAPESTNEFTALVTALAEVEELKKNGLKGDAATIEIGTVTATEPGGAPAVTNSGTSQDAVFNFVLPRGQQGPKGDQGAPGQEQIVFAAASAFPTTGDPAMLYVDNTVSPAIIYTWSGSAYVQASADISTVMSMLATPFSEAESYTAGKYVTYNGQYWRFTVDKAAGAWDASKAEATNIGAELSALNANSARMYDSAFSAATSVANEEFVITSLTLKAGYKYLLLASSSISISSSSMMYLSFKVTRGTATINSVIARTSGSYGGGCTNFADIETNSGDCTISACGYGIDSTPHTQDAFLLAIKLQAI